MEVAHRVGVAVDVGLEAAALDEDEGGGRGRAEKFLAERHGAVEIAMRRRVAAVGGIHLRQQCQRLRTPGERQARGRGHQLQRFGDRGERRGGVTGAERHGGLDAQAVHQLATGAELDRIHAAVLELAGIGGRELAADRGRLAGEGKRLRVFALVGGIEGEIGDVARMEAIRGRALDDRIGAPEQRLGLVEPALVADLKRELDQRRAEALRVGTQHPRLDLRGAAERVLGAGEILRAVVEPAQPNEVVIAGDIGALDPAEIALDARLEGRGHRRGILRRERGAGFLRDRRLQHRQQRGQAFRLLDRSAAGGHQHDLRPAAVLERAGIDEHVGAAADPGAAVAAHALGDALAADAFLARPLDGGVAGEGVGAEGGGGDRRGPKGADRLLGIAAGNVEGRWRSRHQRRPGARRAATGLAGQVLAERALAVAGERAGGAGCAAAARGDAGQQQQEGKRAAKSRHHQRASLPQLEKSLFSSGTFEPRAIRDNWRHS